MQDTNSLTPSVIHKLRIKKHKKQRQSKITDNRKERQNKK